MTPTHPPPVTDWRPSAPWYGCTAPLTTGTACRSPGLLDQVLHQFDVAHHPRYQPRDLSGLGRIDTLCNIYVSDATRALGCEANHLEMGSDGKPRELDANSLIRWLQYSGPRHGWGPALLPKALELVDRGWPVIATWLNPNGIGHVAMLAPHFGQSRALITQAGQRCFEREPLENGFGRLPVTFYVHP